MLHSLTPFVLIIPNLLFIALMRAAIWREKLDATRMSATSINLVMSFTLLVMFIELMLGLSSSSDWFLVTAATTFVSFSYLSSYSFTKYKILNENSSLQYFVVCTLYIVLLLFTNDREFIFILNSLWLLPQIIHNAYIGGRPRFCPWFNAVISFNQIYVVYLLGCKENIYQLEPRYAELMGVLLTLLFQWIILHLQSTQGGRFFVPNIFIPGYHEYIVTVKRGTAPATDICSICN